MDTQEKDRLLEEPGAAINHPPEIEMHEGARRRTPWLHTAFLIAGEIVGTGILGLPFAMSRLGWIVGILATLLFGLFAWYSGVLLARVRNELFPNGK